MSKQLGRRVTLVEVCAATRNMTLTPGWVTAGGGITAGGDDEIS
jgi:hypothetical protein